MACHLSAALASRPAPEIKVIPHANLTLLQ